MDLRVCPNPNANLRVGSISAVFSIPEQRLVIEPNLRVTRVYCSVKDGAICA